MQKEKEVHPGKRNILVQQCQAPAFTECSFIDQWAVSLGCQAVRVSFYIIPVLEGGLRLLSTGGCPRGPAQFRGASSVAACTTQGASLHPCSPLFGIRSLSVASSCWPRSVIVSCEFTCRRVYPCAHTLQAEKTTSEPTSALAGCKEPPEPWCSPNSTLLQCVQLWGWQPPSLNKLWGERVAAACLMLRDRQDRMEEPMGSALVSISLVCCAAVFYLCKRRVSECLSAGEQSYITKQFSRVCG